MYEKYPISWPSKAPTDQLTDFVENMKLTLSSFLLLTSIALAEDWCGHHGNAKHGKVTMSFVNGTLTARYSCQSPYLTVGVVTRSCRSDGTWSGAIPRCENEDGDFSIDLIDKSILIDGDYHSCGHFSTWFHLRFDRIKLFTRFQLWVAVNEKDKVSVDDWNLSINGSRDGSRPFESVVVERNFWSKWVDSTNTHLLSWNPWSITSHFTISTDRNFSICDLKMYSISDECGHPETPLHGTVDQIGTRATYSCDPGFVLVGHSVRECHYDQWDGQQPICKLNISSTEHVAGVKSLETRFNSFFLYRVACFILIWLVLVLIGLLVFMIHRHRMNKVEKRQSRVPKLVVKPKLPFSQEPHYEEIRYSKVFPDSRQAILKDFDGYEIPN